MELNAHRGRLTIRYLKALAACQGRPELVPSFAAGQGWRGDEALVVETAKAAISATGTSAVPLPTPVSVDFAEFVRPQTILGRLQGLRRVPPRTRMVAATGSTTAYWIGEAQPAPISRMTFTTNDTLQTLWLAAVAVTTRELLTSSSPSAESILSRDLAAAAVAALDSAFIDPDNAGTANVKPASITNGVTPITSTGATLSAIDTDLEDVVMALSDAGSTLEFATWIMRPRTAVYLSRLRGTGGALAFPGMTARGGTLLGMPAITSTGVPVESGSPGDGDSSIVLLDPSQILLADDGGGDIELSMHGSLQMLDNPTNDAATPTPTTMVSLFETDSAAIKVRRNMNWRARNAGMVQRIALVAY